MVKHMQEYIIEPTDDMPVMVFEGELVAQVSSERPKSYKWTEMCAYKTKDNKWVISVTFVKLDENSDEIEDDVQVFVFDCDRPDLMIKKMGNSHLVEKLYVKMGVYKPHHTRKSMRKSDHIYKEPKLGLWSNK